MCEDEIVNIENKKISSNCNIKCSGKEAFHFCGGENYASIYSSKNIFIENYGRIRKQQLIV